MNTFTITNEWVSLEKLDEILASNAQLAISEEAKSGIVKCRTYLDEKVAKSDRLIYGVNTGFGSLCDTAISNEDLEQLQRNLVLSHACGMGERVPEEIVRRLLILKIMGLSHGASGVQLETVERLVFFFNNHIHPVVFQQGSLGASGDLAPLAHLVLPLLGEGTVMFEGKEVTSSEINTRFGLSPIALRSKEGLALLNGTQFMSGYASYAISNARKLWKQFNEIAAISLDGFDGRKEPFGIQVNEIRNQVGQIKTAEIFRNLLGDSELANREKAHVQDPYSFRCIPQVHGASYDTIEHCATIVEREINAVTDNPTVFPDDDIVVSAGNFHGQPLALAMDFLAIALAEMGSISERRIYKSISGTRSLPAFLVAKPGLNSGFMITQYTCASIVSQNKQLCTPASIDTIDSSNGQEDHVSMGANAATKLFRVIDNCYSIQGIEILHACQSLEFRRPSKSSKRLEDIFANFRKKVPFVTEDRYMHPLMKASKEFVTTGI
ncbi:histidine ammonia-lyase [Fluviicola taffensis]|uniref:Histidine ammonia-lyase n=1 Tax=Fluviicola taffensis (strain DSM 16823 / NCIMB 13979 / RW262) TaxID=755732 RepID=F2IG59_FLUTR|nr:histidine ammonia-lyase [Fluviicola taffensis]AEA44694.1 histidine ammonia-lyase [Fluviicola taffensis DSM 16823]